MQGETTLDERVLNKLRWIEEVRATFSRRYNFNKADPDGDLVIQLIAEATYLATYQGMDLETMIEQTVADVRRGFPDPAA